MPVAVAAPDAPPGPRDLASTDLDAPSTDVGRWDVSPDHDGGWQLTWTAPEALPVVDARPQVVLAEPVGDVPAGAVLGEARVAADGRTVSLRLPGGSPPDPAALDVRLGGRVLDAPVADAIVAPTAQGPAAAPATTRDPGPAGSHRVVTSDYTRPAVDLPGLADPVEVVGHVEAPADATGRSPLVVLLHGRHPTCHDDRGTGDLAWPCPNGLEGGAEPPRLPLPPAPAGLAGLRDRVGLGQRDRRPGRRAGRRRGTGPGAAAPRPPRPLGPLGGRGPAQRRPVRGRAPRARQGWRGRRGRALETPLSAAYRIRGLVLLAPTDLARRATPYVPSVTFLPSCDGDVLDLQGQAYTDARAGPRRR